MDPVCAGLHAVIVGLLGIVANYVRKQRAEIDALKRED